MTERDLARLLYEAVPPIPRGLATPPYGQIRRRAQRRRALTSLAAGSGVLAVAVGIVVAVSPGPRSGAGPSDQGATPTPSVVTPTPTATASPQSPDRAGGSVRVAQVDRAGTGLTLYVNPDLAACVAYPDVTPVVQEFPDRVVVTFTGEGTRTDCDTTQVASREVRLAQPLGDRSLVDGTGAAIRPFFDADLPQPPPDWGMVPSGFTDLDGSWFMLGYQIPGFQVYISIQVGPSAPGGDAVVLGSRSGVIVPVAQGYRLRWQVRDLTYELWVPPNEGDTANIEDLYTVIELFQWP